MEGLRFNEGKIRMDLVPESAVKALAEVLTKGAAKYAPRNWELGMKWSNVIASLDRHISAFKQGEDFDPETGLHHVKHALCNLAFLVEYYKTYPQGDDRPHNYLKRPKIGLDIDEVLCDWVGAWTSRFGYDIPKTWKFSYNNYNHFKSFSEDELEDFYLNIPPKISPDDIPFEPHCYITSRSINSEYTKKWLQKNGFSTAPVYSVGFEESKIDVAKASGIDWFVDDKFENFVELNNAGICCFLLDAPHNQRYNVGYKRIKTLKDLF